MTRNPTIGAYSSQYNIPDHLGNVRSVVNASGTVLQSTDYYPFGLAFSDSNIASNRYLYNGKELEDYTLGTSYLGTLDYGARHYDPRIARWTVPDPMAEKYYGVNAYSYCVGNPVMMVDPEGRDIYSFDRKTGEISLHRVEDDKDYDTLVEIKHRGGEDKEKVLITNIEKGILYNNVNYNNSDQLYDLTAEGAPSQEGIESFLLELSNLVGREIGGAYFSDNGLSPVSEITVGRYCNNTLRETRSHGHLYWAKKHSRDPLIGIIGFFHTHPYENGREIPSQNDLEARNKNKEMKPSMEFYIITYPIYYGDPTPYKISYTEWGVY